MAVQFRAHRMPPPSGAGGGGGGAPFIPDFFISTTGSDSNDGLTSGTAWALTAINTKQSTYRGKKIQIQNGTYNVYSAIQAMSADLGYTPAFNIDGGSSGSPTVIYAQSVGGVIIECRSGGVTVPTNNYPVIGQHQATHMGYVEIDGFLIQGPNSKGIYLGDYGAAQVGTRYDGYKVRNCEVTAQDATSQAGAGNNCSCLEYAGARGSETKNNYFHDNIGPFGANSSNHFTSILTWYHENYLIEYNTCVNSATIYGKEIGFFGATVRYNYVDNSTDTSGGPETAGFADWCDDSNTSHGVSSVIHHNIFIAPKGIDNRPGLGGSSFVNDNYQYYNNTLIVINSGQSGGLMGKYGTGKVTMYNNLIYSVASGDHCLACLNVNADGLVDYNGYYHSSSDFRFNTYASESATVRDVRSGFSAWKSAMGGSVDANSITGTDPVFTNSGTLAEKYQLQAGSTAKGAGKSDGTSGGSAVDFGAWGNSPPSRIGYLSSTRMT